MTFSIYDAICVSFSLIFLIYFLFIVSKYFIIVTCVCQKDSALQKYTPLTPAHWTYMSLWNHWIYKYSRYSRLSAWIYFDLSHFIILRLRIMNLFLFVGLPIAGFEQHTIQILAVLLSSFKLVCRLSILYFLIGRKCMM